MSQSRSNMIPPCGHSDGEHTPDTNKICFLYLHDEKHNRHWGGNGNVTPGVWKAQEHKPPIPKPIQLGDAVESLLSTIGITKERVSKWLGGPCGCEERKQRLNRFGEWVKRAVTGGSEAKESLERMINKGS